MSLPWRPIALASSQTGPRKPSALPFRLRAHSLSETKLAGIAFQLSAVSVFQRRTSMTRMSAAAAMVNEEQ